MIERPHQEPIINEVQSFLKENYPVRAMDVREILSHLEDQSKNEKMASIIDYHINITIDFTKQSGLDLTPKGKYFEVLHVPARLEAIYKLETKHLDELSFRRLPLSRYIGILAIGEAGSITKATNHGWGINQEELSIRIKKLTNLVSLQQKIQKVSNQL